MTTENWLFAFMACVFGLALWLYLTNDFPPDQRDEEMWP